MYQKKRNKVEVKSFLYREIWQRDDKEGTRERKNERKKKNEQNGARGNQKGPMDRAGGYPSGQLCAIVWRSTMGFYSKSFRFEGGGRQIIGLNRTGKSCRLRWVNYLHPGLKRSKMTPQEERLVLELHAKWGNRWSRIARKLPGRTDNEIKNYWRTHMRKKAQERKRAILSPSSSSSNCSSSSSTVTTVDSLPCSAPGKASFYDTGGHDVTAAALAGKKISEQVEVKEYETGYSMDDIWKDIELYEENTIKPVCDGYSEDGGCNISMVSPSWECCWDSIWKMDEEASKMMINLPAGDQLIYFSNEFGRAANRTG